MEVASAAPAAAAGDSAEAGTGVAAEPDAMASKVRGGLGCVWMRCRCL